MQFNEIASERNFFYAVWLKCVYVCTSELAICFGFMSNGMAISANELWAFMKCIAYAWTISFALNPMLGFHAYQQKYDDASTIISLAKWMKWSLCIVLRLLTFLLQFHDERNGIWCNFHLLAMRLCVWMRKKNQNGMKIAQLKQMKWNPFHFLFDHRDVNDRLKSD